MAPTNHLHAAPEIVAEWTARLRAEAAGLDLADPEDRVTFRFRVQRATDCTVLAFVQGLARAFGHRGPLAPSRSAAQRALADAWIASPK